MKQKLSLAEAFRLYEKARRFMPKARFPNKTRQITGLVDIVNEFDVVLLDSFGVLNVGETVIPGAAACVKTLQDMGKHIIVLTNGATPDQAGAVKKIKGFGVTLDSADIISSRSALHQGLAAYDKGMVWGIFAPEHANCATLDINFTLLGNYPDTYDEVDGFILLSTNNWSPEWLDLLITSQQNNARPLLVGNPDLVAPRETFMSVEPGYNAWMTFEATGIEPENFGKPHQHVFELAKSRIMALCGEVDPARVLMVGDSLHTDILGGAAAGFKTVLTTRDGFLKGVDPEPFIKASGIRPDFSLPGI